VASASCLNSATKTQTPGYPPEQLQKEKETLKKTISLIAALCALLAAALVGCTGNTGKEVNVYNWGGPYIDEAVLKDFEKETGIKVNYSEFQSNEEMYSILKSGSATYDVIVPSDYMVSRLISEGMLEELDFSNIPNYSLIDAKYKKLEYDPDGKYSVAYMTGTVGIIYNTAMISEDITSWSSLFDSRYSGQILMIDNPRDSFGIALKYLGYSQNTVSESEIREAFDLLVSQKPISQAYLMDQICDKLESGEAYIGPYYAGEYLLMRDNNPDLAFVRPIEGSNFFVDAMCVPKGAKNKANAELFIDFMCGTDVAIANMEEIWYASANYEAAEAFSEELDPDDYEIMFASEEVLANCEVFTNLPNETLTLYNDLWVQLKM
jgi:spermidine/putrescine transport system substrate-binding protein